ncbi:Uncharacterised protein [Clostridioides difficile]|nr:hypothetical protein QAO_2521 [Clostridioides difficile CD3]EQG28177.1 hypothetical protein QIK_2644 [Clostridioides difficile DA00126]EQG61973.1 hypothetical protein QK1_2709 [Clostridioides difficile DA00142]EQG75712.1 hypothetical protein QKA_3236 [Clostridioides difficile DA00165]EQG90946.1 hypothetical protein QKK_2834 [Clostridioides difficile DA00191]EQH04341.1 hypothetical protein QKO_2598 [Clostridioides difficile DA00195]EQH07698.1 hypothetical protein QKS_2584 [Clostridioides di
MAGSNGKLSIEFSFILTIWNVNNFVLLLNKLSISGFILTIWNVNGNWLTVL